MKKGKTLKDLAVRLNMSVSTVSKALNDNGAISELTKERVKRLAADWNYIPNEAARHFKQNKTFTLGLIIPDLLDQFYVLAVNGVEEAAAKEGYHVIIAQSHEDANHEAKVVDMMLRNRVDAVIAAASKNTTDMSPFRKLTQTGIPVVFFARAPIDSSFHYVSTDNEDGALKAMNYLFKTGHRRIGHLTGPASMPVTQMRTDGYKKALERKKISFDTSLLKATDLTPVSVFRAVKELMALKNPPTALFVFKNYMSLDVISFLKENFPDALERIAIVGFGNLPLFQHLDHKPSASIDENSFEMGSKAAQLAFRQIASAEPADSDTVQHIKVSCKLVVHNRNS